MSRQPPRNPWIDDRVNFADDDMQRGADEFYRLLDRLLTDMTTDVPATEQT